MQNLREKLEKYLPVLIFTAMREHVCAKMTAQTWVNTLNKPLGSTPNKTVYEIAVFISEASPEAGISAHDIMSTEVLITFNTDTGQFGKKRLNQQAEPIYTQVKKFFDYYTLHSPMSYVTT